MQFKVYKKANEKEGYFNSYTEHFIKYFDKKVQFEKINCYVLHLQSCVQDFGCSTKVKERKRRKKMEEIKNLEKR